MSVPEGRENGWVPQIRASSSVVSRPEITREVRKRLLSRFRIGRHHRNNDFELLQEVDLGRDLNA